MKMKKEKRILNLKNKINLGAREMAQNLGVTAALLEGPCSIPSTHMAANNHLQLQFQGVHMVQTTYHKYNLKKLIYKLKESLAKSNVSMLFFQL